MTEPHRLQALVIDDERDILDLLVGHLRGLGYAVTSAETGERGLALAQADPPDVVLVDVLLPGIDGREVVRRLKSDARTRDCAVIVCSVLDTVDVGEIGADAVLNKPFLRSSLARAVAKVTTRGGR